ncbi:hypothetical protein BDV97DRAFT_365843 [Delphinella strobiligena]|nr:hypothetical protein BDV97DRAFT_365843 [Delphinella strobiligena]
MAKKPRHENEEHVTDFDRPLSPQTTAGDMPRSLYLTSSRHCGSSWIGNSVSRDITDGHYFSETYGTGNWQARFPDALQAEEGRPMNVAGESVIDEPVSSAFTIPKLSGEDGWHTGLPEAPSAEENRRMYAARKPVINKPPPGSFVMRALQNEAEHVRQEGIDRRVEKRRTTLAAKKVAEEKLKKARALSRKPRPKKPKAGTRGNSRIAARGDNSQATDSLLAVPAFSPSKVTKRQSGVSKKRPSRIVILKVRRSIPKSSPPRRASTLSQGYGVELTDLNKDIEEKISPEITESPEANDTVEVKRLNEFMESTKLMYPIEFIDPFGVMVLNETKKILKTTKYTDFTKWTELTDDRKERERHVATKSIALSRKTLHPEPMGSNHPLERFLGRQTDEPSHACPHLFEKTIRLHKAMGAPRAKDRKGRTRHKASYFLHFIAAQFY